MDFKRTLRKLRAEMQLTQEQAARKIGVTLITYARWETGRMNPSLRNLYKLKRVYGIGVQELRELIASDSDRTDNLNPTSDTTTL